MSCARRRWRLDYQSFWAGRDELLPYFAVARYIELYERPAQDADAEGAQARAARDAGGRGPVRSGSVRPEHTRPIIRGGEVWAVQGLDQNRRRDGLRGFIRTFGYQVTGRIPPELVGYRPDGHFSLVFGSAAGSRWRTG